MILEVSFIEIWKTDKDISRNRKPVLLINIDKKNSQQNISKFNSTIYKKE